MRNAAYSKQLIAISASLTGAMASIGTMPVIIGTLMESLDLSEASAGLVGTAELSAMVLSSFAISGVIHRISKQRLAIVGCIIAVIGHMLSACPQNIEAIVIMRCMAGVGEGAMLGAGDAAVANSENPDRLFAVALVIASAAGAVAFLILPMIADIWGHAGIFLALGLFTFMVMPILRWMPATTTIYQSHSPAFESRFPFKKFLFIGSAGFFMFLSQNALWNFAECLGRHISLTTPQISTLLSISMVGGFLGGILAALLNVKIKRLIPIATSYGIGAITSIVLTHTEMKELFYFAFFLNMMAYFIAFIYTIGLSACLDVDGRCVVAVAAMTLIGTMLAPFIGGRLIESFGFSGFGWFVFITELCAFLLIFRVTCLQDRAIQRA